MNTHKSNVQSHKPKPSEKIKKEQNSRKSNAEKWVQLQELNRKYGAQVAPLTKSLKNAPFFWSKNRIKNRSSLWESKAVPVLMMRTTALNSAFRSQRSDSVSISSYGYIIGKCIESWHISILVSAYGRKPMFFFSVGMKTQRKVTNDKQHQSMESFVDWSFHVLQRICVCILIFHISPEKSFV